MRVSHGTVREAHPQRKFHARRLRTTDTHCHAAAHVERVRKGCPTRRLGLAGGLASLAACGAWHRKNALACPRGGGILSDF